MKLREALRTCSPSLALQRAAADEIARLDQMLAESAAALRGLLDTRVTATTHPAIVRARAILAKLEP